MTGIGFVIQVPPGSIGIAITKRQDVSGPSVSSVLLTPPVASILNVGDIIQAVDGTPLQGDADINAWMSVITKNNNQTRKLSILRSPPTAIKASQQQTQPQMQTTQTIPRHENTMTTMPARELEFAGMLN